MSEPVVVIGGGFAGIAAATRLAERGIPVLLADARPFPGGRAISVFHRDAGWIDNGQHVLMGCYRETLELLRRLGTEGDILWQDTLTAVYRGPGGFIDRLRCPRLPGPLHLAAGLWRMKSFGLADLWASRRMQTAFKSIQPGETVEGLCKRARQPDSLTRLMWYPIALSALNETPDRADARLFAEVIQQAFLGRAKASRLGLPAAGLQPLHGDTVARYLGERGGTVRLGASVRRLIVEKDAAAGVEFAGSETVPCAGAISAVPAPALKKILERSGLSDRIPVPDLGSSPILSVYLWLDRQVADEAAACMTGTEFEWAFFRSRFMPDAAETECVCLVKSAARNLLGHGRQYISDLARREMADLFPEARGARVLRSHVFWERHATFAATPENAARRPGRETAIPNLSLAGGWTATGLPDTIEGAVLSGHRCADLW